MTMTKAQRAKKKTEDRKNIRRSILVYSIAIMSMLTVVNNYFQANDIAQLQQEVEILQREAADTRNTREQYYVTKQQLSGIIAETLRIDVSQSVQIQVILEAVAELNADKRRREEGTKTPILPPSI